MWNQLKHIRIYVLCITLVFGFYAWRTLAGAVLTGDDNENKDGHTLNTGGHGGGHGFFYHK